METIDEIGRRAAQAALADVETYVDVEAGLARVTADEEIELDTGGGVRKRWIVIAAAAAVVAAVAAGVVWARQEPSSQIVPATPPETSTAPTTPPTTPTTPAGLSVSYLDPPPLLEPHVFATIATPTGPVAVAETGGVITIDNQRGEAIVVEPDGTTRRVPIECRCAVVAAGPGDVLYAVLQGTAQGLRMVALPLSGDRAGEVVAEFLVDPTAFAAIAGHGPTGIVDRRTGEQVMGYVDTSGEAVTLPDAPPFFAIDENDTVGAADGSPEWPLDIERHPDYVAPPRGEFPPAPTADGGAVYWTGIGPPDEPIDVIAVLAPDGSAEWSRLPEGWTVAASDVWGTILTRRVGEQVELATLAPRSQSGPGTTVAPTTAPPTTAPPSPVAELAEEIGASRLITRGPGTAIVHADGTTTEVATAPGAYVDSDGSLLWWATYTDQPDGNMTSHSTAATLDGTIVCEADGEIHRIRQEADGGYVASVERRDELFSETPVTEEERAVPNYAVDCESGEVQPIEPISWSREGGSRFIQRVGDRTFTGISDSEGNADVTNEDGISIDAEDYAGYHEFNDDGSQVVYGDMTAATHVTNLLRARDTTTGELLWTTELEPFVAGFHWYGDRIVVSVPGDGVPGTANEAVIVLDASTGDVVKTVPVSVDIAFVD